MMRKKLLTIISLLLFSLPSFSILNAQWAITYGGWDTDRAHSIQQTNDGGYIVVGLTPSNIWVLKLDSNGNIDWQRSYGGAGNDRAYSIQQTSDGGYIVAGRTDSFGNSYDYDIWILKLFSNGDIEWQKTYGIGNPEGAYSIQQTIDGGYIVGGEAPQSGHLGGDLWVLKLFSDGDIEWQRVWVDQSPTPEALEIARSIQQTNDGGYIVAGYITFVHADGLESVPDFLVLKLDSNGDIEWQNTYGGGYYEEWAYSIQQTSDGGYIVAGETQSFGFGAGDIWVLKLFPNGDIEWQCAYGDDDGVSREYARSIQQTSDGGYIVTGFIDLRTTQRSEDIIVLKLSPNGDIEWQKMYGGTKWDEAYAIQQANDGGYIVAGRTNSFGVREDDILVLKLSSDGDIPSSWDFIQESTVTKFPTSITAVERKLRLIEYTNVTCQDTDISPGDTNVVANLLYPKEYTLTISNTTGGVTDPASGTYTYDVGTEVTITATPYTDYIFSNWSGDVSSTDNPIILTMDSDKSITANFTAMEEKEEEEEGCSLFGFKLPCFIATVAYGSPLHPHVDILRDFRDKYLMPSKLGCKLVDLYYKYSPFFAAFISKHKALKVAVRIHILPIVAFCYSILHFSPVVIAVILVLILVVPILLVLFYRRKLRHLKASDSEALASRY